MSQVLLNGIVAGLTLGLATAGFFIEYSCVRFFNFTYAAVFMLGGYATALAMSIGAGLPVAAVCGVISAGIAGVLLEIGIYKQMRRRKASPTVLMLASIGAYTLIQNLVSLVAGDGQESIRGGMVFGVGEWHGLRMTSTQGITAGISLIVFALVAALMRWTHAGISMRAVACDPELSRVTGIRAERVVAISTLLGSCLAGLSGILVGLDADIVPSMGMNSFVIAAVATIVGGGKRIMGAVIVTMMLGLAQNLVVWFLTPQWQESIGFFVLLVFLLFKPDGAIGARSRTELR